MTPDLRGSLSISDACAVSCRVAAALSRVLVLGVLLMSRSAVYAQERVEVPSLDGGSQPVLMPGFWSPAPVKAGERAPAMVLLHGCGGPYAGTAQRLGERMLEMAAHLNALGIHALVTDSLSPRGERELCTQRNGARAVTQRHRRLDALGALQWLAQRPEVDHERLGLMGWSNGGSTVLAATNGRQPEVRRAPLRATLAVAFYPGCEADRRTGYEATAPLLMLLGAEDDWTPPQPCEAMAAAARGAPVEVVSYPGAYHGFDGTAPLRLRKDVPNGVNPGQGVHVGAHAPSREAARRRLDDYLRRQWRLPETP